MGVFGAVSSTGGALGVGDASVAPDPVARWDARVAGAWQPSAASIEAAWDDLQIRVRAITSRVAPGTELDDLAVPDRYTLGVFFAARWTLGVVTHRPLSGVESTVTESALRAELGVAEYLIVENAPAWALAAGVRAWIGWLVGATDELAYPQRRG